MHTAVRRVISFCSRLSRWGSTLGISAFSASPEAVTTITLSPQHAQHCPVFAPRICYVSKPSVRSTRSPDKHTHVRDEACHANHRTVLNLLVNVRHHKASVNDAKQLRRVSRKVVSALCRPGANGPQAPDQVCTDIETLFGKYAHLVRKPGPPRWALARKTPKPLMGTDARQVAYLGCSLVEAILHSQVDRLHKLLAVPLHNCRRVRVCGTVTHSPCGSGCREDACGTRAQKNADTPSYKKVRLAVCQRRYILMNASKKERVSMRRLLLLRSPWMLCFNASRSGVSSASSLRHRGDA